MVLVAPRTLIPRYQAILDIILEVTGAGSLDALADSLEYHIQEEIKRLSLRQVDMTTKLHRYASLRRTISLRLAFKEKSEATLFKMAFSTDLLSKCSTDLRITIDEIKWSHEA